MPQQPLPPIGAEVQPLPEIGGEVLEGAGATPKPEQKPGPKWYEPGGDQILDNIRMLTSQPALAALGAGLVTGGMSIPASAALAAGTSAVHDTLNQESVGTAAVDAAGNAAMTAAVPLALRGLGAGWRFARGNTSAALDAAEYVPYLGGKVRTARQGVRLFNKALEKLGSLASSGEAPAEAQVAEKVAETSRRVHPTPPLKPQGITAAEASKGNADLLDKFATMMQGKGAEVVPESATMTKDAAIEALRRTLRSPKIANNPQARKAVEAAIRARGGTP